jgi:glycosyltransferase involved in cell wall biosynthesis
MKVSVVIPTHNRRAWLSLTLRSVLRQHHDDLEAIVVDDGSTDDTAAMLENVSDPRIRVIRNESPRGVAPSRNRGATEARGEWIAFLDDDDLWAPSKLADQIRAAIETGRAWVYTGAVHIDEHGRVMGGMPPPPPDDVARSISRYNVIPGGGSNVVVRREELERVGPFDHRLKNTEDWEMWIRLNARGAPAWVPRPLVGKREHPRMASLDVDAIFDGISLIERRHATKVDHGVLHRWIAEVCLRNGERGQALKHMAVAAVRGQATNVAGDLRTIINRRLSRRSDSAAVASPRHPEWVEEARRWVDEIYAADFT